MSLLFFAKTSVSHISEVSGVARSPGRDAHGEQAQADRRRRLQRHRMLQRDMLTLADAHDHVRWLRKNEDGRQQDVIEWTEAGKVAAIPCTSLRRGEGQELPRGTLGAAAEHPLHEVAVDRQ